MTSNSLLKKSGWWDNPKGSVTNLPDSFFVHLLPSYRHLILFRISQRIEKRAECEKVPQTD